MLFGDFNEKNIDLYSIKKYDNPQCSSMEEYYDDVKRIKYLKRLFNRYRANGDLKDRLILNHIIVFYNVFPVVDATRILFFKMDKEDYSFMKTFLVFLGYMPDRIDGINGKDIISSDISLDTEIIERLRNI